MVSSIWTPWEKMHWEIKDSNKEENGDIGIQNSYLQTTHMWWCTANKVHKNLLGLYQTLSRNMSSSQCRKLSTNLIKLKAGFLILNMNIQNRGDVSIRTGFIYAKNYLKKMFYFYSYVLIRRKVKSNFNVGVKGYSTCTSPSLPLPLNTHHCL